MSNRSWGRPYVKATAVVDGLQCGQWVQVRGYAKKARVVKYKNSDRAYVILPSRRDNKGVVTNVAFRQACGRAMDKVVPTTSVEHSS